MIKIGDRIELIHTADSFTNLRIGDKGAVTDVNIAKSGKLIQIKMVKWEHRKRKTKFKENRI